MGGRPAGIETADTPRGPAQRVGDFVIDVAVRATRGFLAIDRRLQGWFGRLAGPLSRNPLAWVPLAVALVLLFAGAALISVLDRQLQTMHLASQPGFALGKFGAVAFRDAVSVWREFQDASIAALDHIFVSPQRVAAVWLMVDTLVFVPAYLVAGMALFVRGHEASPGQVVFQRVMRWAGLFLVVTAVLDFVENSSFALLLDPYWKEAGRDAGIGAATWIDGALGVVSWLKWGCGLLALLALLPLALGTFQRRTAGSQETVRLLQPVIVVTVVTLVLLNLPIQVTDLFLAMDGVQAVIVFAAAALAAVAIWSAGRVIVSAAERRRPRPGVITGRAILALLVIPALIWVWASLTGGNPRAALIPLGLVVIVGLIGLVLRDVIAERPQPPQEALPQLALFAPQALACAAVAAVGVAALRGSVLQWVQKGPYSLLLTLGISLLLGSLAFAFAIHTLEARLAGTRPDFRGRSRDHGEKRVEVMLTAALGDDVARRRHGVYVMAALGCGALLALIDTIVIVDPQRASALGAVAVVLLFVASITLAVTGISLAAASWTSRFGLPYAFRALRLQAIPIFMIILLWGVVAAALDDGAHWDVTVLPKQADASIPYEGITLEGAFQAWIDKQNVPIAAGERTPVPMVIVAASGGGIRAAYWTALSLDCLLLGRSAVPPKEDAPDPCAAGPADQDVGDHLFLASGISGGSLGLVEWDANQHSDWARDWVERRLGEDYAAPTVAQGLFVEIPRSLLQFGAPGRAETLEDSWIRSWGETARNPMAQGFLEAQAEALADGGPFLLLNGASVFDGCALNVSILELGSTIDQAQTGVPIGLSGGDCTSVERYTGAGPQLATPRPGEIAPAGDDPGPLPATADLLDYLGCPEAGDVSRATAALLSARFTYVSPAGQLLACGGRDSTKYIVDGGYVDTSAAEAAMAAWFALDPLVREFNATDPNACIVPFFVQIDNTYLPTISPREDVRPPNQVLAPVSALYSSTGLKSRAERARALAAATFTLPYPPRAGATRTAGESRYALIAPRAHPGVEAPLGWTLSEASRRDLEAQLYRGNETAIAQVRSWFEDFGACSP